MADIRPDFELELLRIEAKIAQGEAEIKANQVRLLEKAKEIDSLKKWIEGKKIELTSLRAEYDKTKVVADAQVAQREEVTS